MILVFSSKKDFSTVNVCDWLKYYNANYTKYNTSQKLDS